MGLVNESDWGKNGVKLYISKVNDTFTYVDPDSNWLTDNAHYINDGTVNIKGIEITFNTKLLGWQLDTNIDFNQAINKSSNLQKGRRPNRSIGINLFKSNGKWRRNVNWSAKSWVWDKDDHSNGKLGGYGLLNLSTNYNFNEELSVYFNINNALDKGYEMAKGYNTLGRNINLGISRTF